MNLSTIFLGLNGKDDWEAVEINQFAEFHRDLFTILGAYMLPKIGLSQEAVKIRRKR